MDLKDAGWNILGTFFRCLAAPADVGRKLEVLLKGFQDSSSCAEGVVDFEVVRNGDSVRLILLDSPSAAGSFGLKSEVSGCAEYLVICEAIRRARERFVLHAAGVVTPDGTCLITGQSESGKTTLALFLWSQGMDLISDDLCPIPYHSLTPEVFPRALHLNDQSPTGVLNGIPARPRSYPGTHYPFLGPVDVEVPPVTAILALEKGGPPKGELVPLTQSEAAHQLLKASIRAPHFRFADVLDGVIRISSGAMAHQLRASTPEGAVSVALQLLRG